MIKAFNNKFGQYRHMYGKNLFKSFESVWRNRRRDSSLKKIPDFPLALHVEVTNHCDNKCIFCTRNDMTRPLHHMSENMFVKIIDECATHSKTNLICLFKDGDPILNPNLPRLIRYANERRAAKMLTIATSANALSPELSEQIILSGIDEVIFSLDALTEESYRKIKGTENYGRVIKNIFDFIKTRKRLKSKTPTVIIKMLATDLVKDDIEMFVNLWKHVADSVVIDRELTVWDGTNSTVNSLILPMEGYNFKKPELRCPCNRPWYIACIYSDGKVGVCPEDWDQKMIIGDVNTDSLYDIWNGDKLHEIKKAHIEGDWDKLPSCKTCEAWVLRNLGGWFRTNSAVALQRKSLKR